jgi:hypothetical protein
MGMRLSHCSLSSGTLKGKNEKKATVKKAEGEPKNYLFH